MSGVENIIDSRSHFYFISRQKYFSYFMIRSRENMSEKDFSHLCTKMRSNLNKIFIYQTGRPDIVTEV